MLTLALAAPNAVAQAPTQSAVEDEGDSGEIVVTASRIAGVIDAPQQPVLTLDPEAIASYGASSLSDLIAALGPQTGSGRGRGGGHPVILFNGQRISNFREMRNIPPEAIRRMEVLPEEVALRFGFPPDQRVINFILRDDFASKSFDAEYNAPSRGGFAETEFEASLLRIGKTDRLNLNFKAEDRSLLTEAERGVIQQASATPGLTSDPDPALYRSLVADSRELSAAASWSKGLGEEGLGGSLALNGSITREDSRSLFGLDSVVLAAPGEAPILRRLDDPLERTSRTVTVAGGGAFNKPLGGWQLSATVDGSHADEETRTDRRADTTSLAVAAAAGLFAPDGPLPAMLPAGASTGRSRTLSLNSLVTLSGPVFRLPAGEAFATIKGGYEHSGIRSSDNRAGLSRAKLTREDRYGGINLSLPIASRRENVLAGAGDITLNLSAGVASLSDFGTLTDWSAGLTWGVTEKLGLQASYLVDQQPPSLSDLGNPLIRSLNVPVYDFLRGETALVTVTNGGNPALKRETQRDIKLSANWELPLPQKASLLVEYFRNRSSNVTQGFPVLTPAIEAAFPDRAVRDAAGALVALDRRPVTFAATRAERLRWGINISGPLGKPNPPAAEGGRRRGQAAQAGAGGPPRAGGAPRMGGGGPMSRFMGGGNGQGRWNLSAFHTLRFSEKVLVAPGGPLLDLLEGDALNGGGVARHAVEMEGGAFYRGFGLRLNGKWTAPTRIDGAGLPGTSDLRFGSTTVLNLRAFVDFDRQARVLKAVPALKGSRLAFVVDNLFDSRQKVTDASGATPLSYQKDYIDPRGRFIGIDFRKVF